MKPITVNNISKSYGPVPALRDVSFEVREGEIFGLIGPDGAGKTTLFRILTSLMLPDGGAATVLGLDTVRDYKRLRPLIGYMPGRFSLYQDLSVEENLEFFAAVFGTSIRKNYELIAPIYTQIEPFKKRRAGALSGGMKQKLALCCALIHRPALLFLDEPGTGVDPVSRKEFWDMLQGLRKYGITMLVSTPNMDEAELCDRVALLQKGEILALEAPQGIVRGFHNPLYAVRSADMYRLIRDLRTYDGAVDCYAFGEYAHLKIKTDAPQKVGETSIRHFLETQGHERIEVKPAEATIEDCFIELMTRGKI
jgi:ABC-2 type transport system ATP-binding protein